MSKNGPSSAVFLQISVFCIIIFHSFTISWILAKFGDAGLQTSQLQLLVARGWGRPTDCGRVMRLPGMWWAENSWGLGEPLFAWSKLSPAALPAPACGALWKQAAQQVQTAWQMTWLRDWGCGWWGVGGGERQRRGEGRWLFQCFQESSEQRLKLCGRGQERINRGLAKLSLD